MQNGTPANESSVYLNVVFHGTMLYVLRTDGSFGVLIPKMPPGVDHSYRAGTWDKVALGYLAGNFSLVGVTPGDGSQRFSSDALTKKDYMIGFDSDLDDSNLQATLVLPPPESIRQVNFITRDPGQPSWFVHGKPGVTDPPSLALLQVLTYQVPRTDELSFQKPDGTKLKQRTESGAEIDWVPVDLPDGKGGRCVNFHVFAEPEDYPPLYPGEPVAWDSLIELSKGALPEYVFPNLYRPFNIDPGDPIDGLPLPQQGALADLITSEPTANTPPVHCGNARTP